jgi:hypothetical protein
MISQWLKIDRRKFKTSRTHGHGIVFLPSPYDLPEAVRGFIDQANGKLVIQIKYLGGPEEPNEPLDTESQDEHLVFRVGRHSHRLYRIEIDPQRIGAVRMLQDVDEGIDWLSGERKRPTNRGRYSIAKIAVSERGRDLISTLVPLSKTR